MGWAGAGRGDDAGCKGPTAFRWGDPVFFRGIFVKNPGHGGEHHGKNCRAPQLVTQPGVHNEKGEWAERKRGARGRGGGAGGAPGSIPRGHF